MRSKSTLRAPLRLRAAASRPAQHSSNQPARAERVGRTFGAHHEVQIRARHFRYREASVRATFQTSHTHAVGAAAHCSCGNSGMESSNRPKRVVPSRPSPLLCIEECAVTVCGGCGQTEDSAVRPSHKARVVRARHTRISHSLQWAADSLAAEPARSRQG